MFRDENCEGVRRAWFGEAPILRAHARDCAACASWITRRERLESALLKLERPTAPSSLDGLVVASLHPGYRQDRAVRSLGRLATENAPENATPQAPEQVQDELELGPDLMDLDDSPEREAAMIDSLPRLATPGVLERLVSETLAGGAGGRVRSALDRLPRQSAPASLDQGVAETLARGEARSGQRAMSWLRRPRAGLWTAAAALVVISGLARLNRAPAPEPETYSFRIRRVTQAGDLSSEARGLVEPLWGSVLPSGALKSTIPDGGSR